MSDSFIRFNQVQIRQEQRKQLQQDMVSGFLTVLLLTTIVWIAFTT